jgi:hypothetical protein
MFARVIRQASTLVLVSIDGRLAENAEERTIPAVRQTLGLIVLLSCAVVVAAFFVLINAH